VPLRGCGVRCEARHQAWTKENIAEANTVALLCWVSTRAPRYVDSQSPRIAVFERGGQDRYRASRHTRRPSGTEMAAGAPNDREGSLRAVLLEEALVAVYATRNPNVQAINRSWISHLQMAHTAYSKRGVQEQREDWYIGTLNGSRSVPVVSVGRMCITRSRSWSLDCANAGA